MTKLSTCVVTALAILSLASCKKVGDSLRDAGSMTANAGGTAFTASGCTESFVLGGTEDIVIKGTGTDGTSFIVLDIKQAIRGNDTFDGTGYNHTARYVTRDATRYARSGTFHITSDSPGVAMSGTFSFVTGDGLEVNGGNFRAVFK